MQVQIAERSQDGMGLPLVKALDVFSKAGVDASRAAPLPFAENGHMGVVQSLAIEHGVKIQELELDWGLVKSRFTVGRAVQKIQGWRDSKAKQASMFGLADRILRGEEPTARDLAASLHGVTLASLHHRHGRTIFDAATADGCKHALFWLARMGVAACKVRSTRTGT